MKIFVLGLTLVASVMAFGACSAEREYEGYSEEPFVLFDTNFAGFVDSALANMKLSQANLGGALGPVRDFQHQATAAGYEESGLTQIDVISEGAEGSAMHAVTIFGNLEEFEVGKTYKYSGDEVSYESGQNVSVVLCSGKDQPGKWEMDEEAQEVNIVVKETEQADVVELDVKAISYDGDVSESHIFVDRSAN